MTKYNIKENAQWFNKQWWIYHVTTNYVHNKVNGTNWKGRNTLKAAYNFWINQNLHFYTPKTKAEPVRPRYWSSLHFVGYFIIFCQLNEYNISCRNSSHFCIGSFHDQFSCQMKFLETSMVICPGRAYTSAAPWPQQVLQSMDMQKAQPHHLSNLP